jgi:hypothetical protein
MGKMENRKSNLLFNKEKRQAVLADSKAKPYYLNQRTLFSHFFFGPYVLFPIISGLTWLGGLLALIAIWVKQGKPRYKSDEATVVFVSDGTYFRNLFQFDKGVSNNSPIMYTVGAANHTLFICITAVTAGFYILSLFAERWLRHIDRLPEDVRRRERIFDWLAIFFGTLGGIGLILLGAVSRALTGKWKERRDSLFRLDAVRCVQPLYDPLVDDRRFHPWCRHLRHLPIA